MTFRSVQLEFGEWLPDLPPLDNPGALEALNCVPELESFRSLASPVSYTGALTGPALGGFWTTSDAGVVFNFAGDATDLYRLINVNTWQEVSLGGAGGYAGVTHWEFAKFGDNVIAVSPQFLPQIFDLGSGTAFANLTGTPPIGDPGGAAVGPPTAARIGVVRDFVVLGDLRGSPNQPSRIQWSGLNNANVWDPDIATQADFQDLPGRGGRVQRIVPGEYGLIFCEHSIFRMDYIGPPTIFQIDELERGRGTPAPDSVAWTGEQVFYYGHDGFYVHNGRTSTPIGSNRVDRWFRDNASQVATDLDQMRAAVDRQNRLVIWTFRTGTGLTNNDHALIYNWAADKWAHAAFDSQIIYENISAGVTLEGLDALVGTNIDALTVSFDSTVYQGGVINMTTFDTSNQAATFAGPALAAAIDTKEVGQGGDYRMMTHSVRPLVDTSDATVCVQAGSRNSLAGSVMFAPARTLNPNGEASIRLNSRYQRFRVHIMGSFTHANGVIVRGRRRAGRR